jgi:hypothetical protein
MYFRPAGPFRSIRYAFRAAGPFRNIRCAFGAVIRPHHGRCNNRKTAQVEGLGLRGRPVTGRFRADEGEPAKGHRPPSPCNPKRSTSTPPSPSNQRAGNLPAHAIPVAWHHEHCSDNRALQLHSAPLSAALHAPSHLAPSSLSTGRCDRTAA